mmetsp:Transcript_26696/g.42344  ORF Transcript_26696/g.42344 Transcript_26696/m.42344 type:complete len:100 (+) Transcript_26696:337-636(+)
MCAWQLYKFFANLNLAAWDGRAQAHTAKVPAMLWFPSDALRPAYSFGIFVHRRGPTSSWWHASMVHSPRNLVPVLAPELTGADQQSLQKCSGSSSSLWG